MPGSGVYQDIQQEGKAMTRNEEEERRLVIKMVKLLESMATSQQQIVNVLEMLVDNLESKGEKDG